MRIKKKFIDTRNGKLKMTSEQFKQYLLDNYLDENNNKISERKLINMPKFMEETGMYKLDTRTGVRTPISMGTIAYWKNKLNLKDYDIYKYHRDVTKRITIDYEDWTQSSRRLNREKKIKKGVLKDTVVYTPELEKEKLIKECSFPKHFVNYTLERLRNLAFELWEDMGLNPVDELTRIQKDITVYQKLKALYKKSEENKKKYKKKKKEV